MKIDNFNRALDLFGASAFTCKNFRVLCANVFHVFVECDQTFVSRAGGPQNGTFHAPSFINPRGHSRQCVYTFIAGPGQRVEIIFTNFALRGSPPE